MLLLLGLHAAFAGPAHARAPAASLPAPDPRDAFLHDRNFDMVRLELDLSLDLMAHAVAGAATWEVSRLAPGDLRLDAVAFAEVSATVDGAFAAVTVADDELVVSMPADAAAGVRHIVKVQYKAAPQLGLHWRGPAGGGGPADSPDRFAEVYSQGELEDNRYWFPSYDHPDDRFAYQGRFSVAGAAEGTTVITNSGEDLPSYLVMVAAAPYVTVAGPAGPVPTRAMVAPKTPEAWVRPVLDPLPDMMAWFGERAGVPYAWGRYDQTFVQRFIYGGMENTGSTIETSGMIAPPSVQATREWIPSIVAHELAHQWFGDLLTARTDREMWLNEGFATFFAGDWEVHDRRVREGDAAADALAASMTDGWRRASLDRGGLAGRWYTGGGGRVQGGEALGESNHNVYNKGAMTLTMLRVYLGEEAFWAGMHDYVRAHVHQSVDTLDLQRALEARSGRDLGWFFQQWTELPGVPKLTTSWRWEATEGGGTLSVEVDQQPAEGSPLYTLPVDVSADGAAPTRGWLTGEHLTITMPLAKAPSFVAIDPRGGLLVDWDQHQPIDAWNAQLRDGSPYARLLAAHALAKLRPADDDAVEELFVARSTPEPLRAALAAALGERRTCAPLLPAAREDADARIRLAAAGSLGSCPDSGLAPLLVQRVAAEPNGDVRATLLGAIRDLDGAAGLAVARRTLGREDVLVNERAAAAELIGAAGVPSDVPSLLKTPAERDLRLSGLRAATRIVQRQPLGDAREKLRRTVAASAERQLDDLDLRGLQGGMSVLRDVGDRGSIALLEALARRSTVPDTAKAARDAAEAIRGRKETVVPPGAPAEDARMKELEARVKALEAAKTEKH